MLLAACESHGRTDSSGASSRASDLAGDLQIAARSSAAPGPSGHDTAVVTDAPAMLDPSGVGAPTASDDGRASEAVDASSRGAPSADEYLDPSCSSPALDDQRRCLRAYLAKSDVLLDRYYQALILRLKSEETATSTASEPPGVQRLRATQRAWLVYRDDECRRRTREREGPLWAPVRARCLAEYSARRAEELADALARRKSVAPLEPPKPSVRSRAHKPARHSRPRRR
jgi:uncharacterized protein YecT (DUF1311 family)